MAQDKATAPKDDGQNKPTPDLMSSAKLLAGAAKSTISNDGNKVDKAHVANATGDLLSAAKDYGHLQDTSYGKYIDKAEDYLHQYHSSNSPSSAAQHGGDGKDRHSESGRDSCGGGELVKMAEGLLKPGDGGSGGGGGGEFVKMAEGLLKPDQSHGGGNGGSGGGGELVKMAEGLLKPGQSHGGGDGGSGGGGAGDLIQMAEGFLKKN